eukprot:TRINITY_DN195_c0_g1_i1.p1 TRINITY_DN195_c0_g1~~TRINITY_DN195_c0_g1_i1.p1  ORF type:complete len:138 (+),score=16.21 TRINITY_DN195_c0_g1_i1:156-569(+)
MYKKHDDSVSSSLLSISSWCSVIIVSVLATGFAEIFFSNICVSDLIFNLDSTLFFFDVENTSVNTEILARRIGSGLATAGLGGVGTGIGLVFSGLIKGFSRNPSLKDDLFSYAIFGFALTEAIGLFALMMAFMLLYA